MADDQLQEFDERMHDLPMPRAAGSSNIGTGGSVGSFTINSPPSVHAAGADPLGYNSDDGDPNAPNIEGRRRDPDYSEGHEDADCMCPEFRNLLPGTMDVDGISDDKADAECESLVERLEREVGEAAATEVSLLDDSSDDGEDMEEHCKKINQRLKEQNPDMAFSPVQRAPSPSRPANVEPIPRNSDLMAAQKYITELTVAQANEQLKKLKLTQHGNKAEKLLRLFEAKKIPIPDDFVRPSSVKAVNGAHHRRLKAALEAQYDIFQPKNLHVRLDHNEFACLEKLQFRKQWVGVLGGVNASIENFFDLIGPQATRFIAFEPVDTGKLGLSSGTYAQWHQQA